MDKLKIGVVGVGERGPQHLNTITALTDQFELIGICDMDDERREAAVSKFGGPGFANPEEMMDKGKPDVVTFTVSPRDLASLVKLAADRGIHVATETPIANSLPEADHLIETAQAGGIKLENFEQCWRWPREQVKRKLLESGILGDMIQARCYTYVAPYHANGVFLLRVGSRVKQVVGFGHDLPMCTAGPDPSRNARKWVVGALEFENGVSGVFEMKIRATQTSGHDFTNVDVDCTQGHIIHEEIYIAADAAKPKNGGVHEKVGNLIRFPFQEQWEEVNGHRTLTKVWIDTDPEIAWEHPYLKYATEPIYPTSDDYGRMEEYVDWHDVVTNDKAPVYGMENARHNIEVMIACHHSAQNGSSVLQLPLDPSIDTRFR